MALGKSSKKKQKANSEVPSKNKVSGEKTKAQIVKTVAEMPEKNSAGVVTKSRKKSPAVVNVESAVQDRVVVMSESEPLKTMAATAGSEEPAVSVESTVTPSNGLRHFNGSHHEANGSHHERAEHAKGERSISREDIAHLAYRYWAERGYHHGSAEEDWKRAEVELLSRS